VRSGRTAVRPFFAVSLTLPAVAGCGSSTLFQSAHPRNRDLSAAEQALKLWDGFPATASPRPVLVLGQGAVLAPITGFDSADAKLAFLEGRFTLRVALPKTSATVGGRAVMSAGQTLRMLRDQGGPGPTTTSRLAITGVRLTSAVFTTNRGSQTLPAWAFSLRGQTGPADVLALTGSGVFVAPRARELLPVVSSFEMDRATTSAAGRTVRLRFAGGPPGDKPGDVSYTVGSASDAHAVAFWLTAHSPRTNQSALCSAVGYFRTAAIHLTRPLGGRVLVDAASAGAVPVTDAR
jgi:hypothetical protein